MCARMFFSAWLMPTKSLLKCEEFIWLPNNDYVEEKLTKHADLLKNYYTISRVVKPPENPLFMATDLCQTELAKCSPQYQMMTSFKTT